MVITYDGINTKVSQKEFCEMALFFGGLLIEEKFLDKLKLFISFAATDAVPKWDGYTQQLDGRNSYMIWIRPSKGYDKQVRTFAHEMVHIKQYLKGQLCPHTGKALDARLVVWATTPGYYDNPTEIEAFGRTYGLVDRYYQQKNMQI